MESNYYGLANMSDERGNGSSRKSKKSYSDRPKQPQRGLGVAQLEKIRLHGQMGCHYSPHGQYAGNFSQEDGVYTPYSSLPSSSVSSPSQGYNQTMLSMVGEYERTNGRYGDSFTSAAASWNNGDLYDSTHYNAQSYSTSTSHFLNPSFDLNSQQTKKKKHGGVSESSQDAQELDLELRLSL